MSVAIQAPPALEACDDPAAGSGRHRLAFWKSPDGQPPWARPTLLGIAAFAAFLYSWHLADAGLAPFYSTAVKSMSESWKAFFYGAFDPAATVTIDKLAGSIPAAGVVGPDLRLPSLVARAAAGNRGRDQRARAVPGRAPVGRELPQA